MTSSAYHKESRSLRAYEREMQRRILELKRKEERGWWRKRCTDTQELYNLYYSSNFIRIIESRTMKLGGSYSTHGGDEKFTQDFSRRNFRKKQSGDLGLL
jgi:hypothetical protein